MPARLCNSCCKLKVKGDYGERGTGYEAKWFCTTCWQQWDTEVAPLLTKPAPSVDRPRANGLLPPWSSAQLPALPPEAQEGPAPIHQVLCINLDRRAKRWSRFMMSARYHGLAEITRRFPAVDGQALDLEKFPRDIVVDAGVRAAMRPPRLVCGVALTRGALGLILTWHKLLQEIAADSCREHVYLICEDDAVFTGHFARWMHAVTAEAEAVEPEWDLIHVGYYNDDCALRQLYTRSSAAGKLLVRPVVVYGLFGAALRPPGAKKLLQGLFPLTEQIDSGLATVYPRIRALATRPSLMHAEHSAPGATDIQIIPKGHVQTRYGHRILPGPAEGPPPGPAPWPSELLKPEASVPGASPVAGGEAA